MRRVASLFALGVVMALLHRVTANSPLEARATLALAFLLLAAYLGADLALKARLPRVTSYVLVGFAVGPAWLGLVRREEVEALGFLHDAALTLIALTVGMTLRLSELRRDRLALTRVAAGAIVFPFVVVSLITLSVTRSPHIKRGEIARRCRSCSARSQRRHPRSCRWPWSRSSTHAVRTRAGCSA